MSPSRASAIGEHLPYLRRFARAMTGTQAQGDAFAIATLEGILDGTIVLAPNLPLNIALFRAMYALDLNHDKSVHARLSGLTPSHRAALLLRSIEDLSVADISLIMERPIGEVFMLITAARKAVARNMAGQVLIIEDEALIAADLQAVAIAQGHTITGIARTRQDAVTLGMSKKPDLILADVQLADGSSGIDAVKDLIAKCGDVPVIFITAFPELLLTGMGEEPAFLISKPFTDGQVHSCIAQAMFFASEEKRIAAKTLA